MGSLLKGKLSSENAKCWNFAFIMLLSAVAIMLPAESWAQTNAVSDVLCDVVNVLQGPIARGMAAFAIITLGFTLFLGKISWGVAIALAIGIGAVFGAEQIVDTIATTADSTGTATCT